MAVAALAASAGGGRRSRCRYRREVAAVRHDGDSVGLEELQMR